MLNVDALNEVPLNGSASNCQGDGALNGSALNETALGGGGDCNTSSATGNYIVGQASASFHCSTYSTGAAGVALTTSTFTTGTVSLDLSTAVNDPTGYAGVVLRCSTHMTGIVSAGFTVSAGATIATGTVSAGLHCSTHSTGVASTVSPYGGLRCSVGRAVIVTAPPNGQVTEPGSVGGITHNWQVMASMGSGRLPLTGQVDIDAEENGARTASFTVAGVADAEPGQRVVVELLVDSTRTRLYSGIIQRTTYRPDSDETAISCTDQLQQYVDALTNEQIDAITPGAITAPGTTEKGYAYLTSRLATVPMSAFLKKDGSFIVASWQASSTETKNLDRTLYQTVEYVRSRPIPAGTETPTPPKRQEYRIVVNISWMRIARTSVQNTWNSGIDACGFLAGTPLPYPDTIRQAADGAGWDIDQLDIGTLGLRGGWAQCGTSSPYGLLVPPGFVQPATTAIWRMSKRFSRSMSARIVWRVIDGSADRSAPVQVNEQTISIRDPRDGNDWVEKGVGTLSGYVDANGDEFADLLDIDAQTGQIGTALDETRQQVVNAQQRIAYQVATAGIRLMRDRRGESLSCETIIRPDLDLGDTLTISHPRISKTGVISRLAHRLNIDTGTAITEVQISIYTPSTNGSDGTPAPAATDEYTPGWSHVVPTSGANWLGGTLGTLDLGNVATRLPTTAADDVMSYSARPKTYIGGAADMLLPESDVWQGWIANKSQSAIVTPDHPANFYPTYQKTGFFIRVPPIHLPTDQTDPIDAGERLIVI